MELTVTYNIEVTEVIKDPGTIEAVLSESTEDIAAKLRMCWRSSDDLDVDDVNVQCLKRFYNEEPAT